MVGVGLIGGSVAAALKRERLVDRVVGVGRSRANMQQALSAGVIDEQAQDLTSAARGAELVLVAVPVRQTASVLQQLRQAVADGVIVTDAGSTKRDFVHMARDIFGSSVKHVVPGHPIAGAERSGVAAATADLYTGKRVVLTPLPDNENKFVERVASMWRACGANVIQMSPEHHDAVFSAVSHLPHVLSYALVELIASRDNAEELFSFAAGGFRDFTRIAGSSPEMWRDICDANADQLLRDIDAFQQALSLLAGYIRSGDMDKVEAVFAAAARARNAWVNSLK
ncbi:MAG: prephenate dehydrogenase/arogenate dehydrogenase family protein [Betaproteobacteria bacterium]|nr:MAG: prephenate dehydrogenase/arogenate dehydrogenase family protein [Betaproteobacteria bacterium]